MYWVLFHFPLLFGSVTCLDLIGVNQENEILVADRESFKFLCYPEPLMSSLPALDQNDFLPNRNAHLAGRVLCRQLGYTHVVSIEKFSVFQLDLNSRSFAPFRMESLSRALHISENLKWEAECQGYEPDLQFCPMMTVLGEGDCDDLLALKCGRCTRTHQISVNESLSLTSPEYPDYSEASVCQWRIESSSAEEELDFVLNFTTFRIPGPDDLGSCSRSVLEIAAVHVGEEDEDVKSVKILCGGGTPDPFVITAHAVILRFSSGIFYPRSGTVGFNLTIDTKPPDPSKRENPDESLPFGEMLSIILGCILAVMAIVLGYFIVRRVRLERRWTNQREVMHQRLLLHQRPDAHLTSLLSSIAYEQTRACDATRQGGVKAPFRASRNTQENWGRGSMGPLAPIEPAAVREDPYSRPPVPPPLPRHLQVPPSSQTRESEEVNYIELDQLRKRDPNPCVVEETVSNSTISFPSMGVPSPRVCPSQKGSASPSIRQTPDATASDQNLSTNSASPHVTFRGAPVPRVTCMSPSPRNLTVYSHGRVEWRYMASKTNLENDATYAGNGQVNRGLTESGSWNDFEYNSSESVFQYAESPGNMGCIDPTSERPRSCGDVSTVIGFTQRRCMEDLHCSMPNLVRDGQSKGKVGHALRRVSEKLGVGSAILATPPEGEEASGGTSQGFRSRISSATSGFLSFRYNRLDGEKQ